MISTPYRILGGLIVMALLLVVAVNAGRRWESNRRDAQELALTRRIDAARDKLVAANNTLSRGLAAARSEQDSTHREIIREATTIITRPVYQRSDCVDADGLRLLDRAYAAANRGIAGEPDRATTGAAADPATGGR